MQTAAANKCLWFFGFLVFRFGSLVLFFGFGFPVTCNSFFPISRSRFGDANANRFFFSQSTPFTRGARRGAMDMCGEDDDDELFAEKNVFGGINV